MKHNKEDADEYMRTATTLATIGYRMNMIHEVARLENRQLSEWETVLCNAMSKRWGTLIISYTSEEGDQP